MALALVAAASFCAGYMTHRNELLPQSLRDAINSVIDKQGAPGGPEAMLPGNWKRARTQPESFDEQARELMALGYLAGYEPADTTDNVTIHDPALAFDGLNLVVAANEPAASLVTMEGATVHVWQHEFRSIWPDYEPPPNQPAATGQDFWRRVFLYPNGDLLAIHSGIGLIKLDRDSNLLWSYSAACHHEVTVGPDDNIHVLIREAKRIPAINKSEPVLEDFVAVLSPEGKELRRVSLLACFQNSRYASYLDKMPYRGDLFHTNSIEILDETMAQGSDLFKRGYALISVYSLNTIAIVDLERAEVVWALSGMWVRQHHARLLPEGTILLFDNQGNKGQSKVVEIEPFTQEFAWEYKGTEEMPFHSNNCGACYRLPNQNTLIVESNNGRAFEVTREGRIVWEYYTPHRTGENRELVANLLDVERLTTRPAWLKAGP